MAIAAGLYPLFSHTVEIAYRSTSLDKWGKPSYGTPVEFPAAIERSNDLFREDGGREVVSKRKVFLWKDSWTAADIPQPTDKLILPATHQSETTTAQIMMAQVVSDERGIAHVVLWC